ncbi:Cytochrome P450 82C4 [Striga hermonthica]|uniref:Flavonoid-6-hydroxylase n=1 Tax=Striga hermonthica TaxID=68872 RepID=A0A9N7NZG6_STRHE|nr:Cytochrome P450 82C4 [Striga hermonthica]
MELNFSILGAISASLLFLFYCLRPTKNATHKSPPEAGGARPFTGHLHLMFPPSELPYIALAALSDTYGPAFTVRLGMRRALVVSSRELAKHLFTTCDSAISSRPVLRAACHLSRGFATFGFSPYGPHWIQMRRLVSTELLSARQVKMQRDVRASETALSVNELFRRWEERKDGSGWVLVDMKKWVGELTLNMVLRLVAGKRLAGINDGGEEIRRCREMMRSLFELAGMFVVADALPYLGWLDIGGHEKRMRENARELERLVGGWLAEHREKEYGYDDDYKPRDFMDVMVSVMRSGELQTEYDDDTIIKATCEALIVGGTDSTTVMLIWALSLLLNNPHALNKAQEELDTHVGKERHVDESDIGNLVYLQAITKETLRLCPAGPLLGVREFSEDCNVSGYHIPKGTWLMVNAWKLHRDPHVWGPDALEFKPERFLGEHRNLDVKGRDFKLIPFSAGRRICPGANSGLQMMNLVLANLLHGFELSTVSGKEVDMTGSHGMINMKALPLDVLLAPRLSQSLYN